MTGESSISVPRSSQKGLKSRGVYRQRRCPPPCIVSLPLRDSGIETFGFQVLDLLLDLREQFPGHNRRRIPRHRRYCCRAQKSHRQSPARNRARPTILLPRKRFAGLDDGRERSSTLERIYPDGDRSPITIHRKTVKPADRARKNVNACQIGNGSAVQEDQGEWRAVI
jgi:hypothetical protein